MKNKAIEYFKQGYSCSESMIKAAVDEGLVSKELLPAATSFSGGMASGCLCGAVAGCQMVIGAMHGRNDMDRDGQKARGLAKEFVEKFKAKNKFTCCKALTSGMEHHSPERKAHCTKIVEDAATIIEEVLELGKQKV